MNERFDKIPQSELYKTRLDLIARIEYNKKVMEKGHPFFPQAVLATVIKEHEHHLNAIEEELRRRGLKIDEEF